MKKTLMHLLICLSLILTSLMIPDQSHSFGFGDMMDSVKKKVDDVSNSTTTSPKDTGAASRDEYMRNQQIQKGSEANYQLASSIQNYLKHAEEELNENRLSDANTSLRMARSNMNNLKSNGGDVSALEARYNKLLQKAEEGKQTTVNSADAERLLVEYMGLLDQVGYSMDSIAKYGGYQLSNSEGLFKAAQAASQKKTVADKALPLVNNSGTPERIRGFFKTKLPEFVNGDFNVGIKDLMAKANKSGNIDDARAADLMCDAVLLLDSSNDQAKKMKVVVGKSMKKLGGALGGADAVKNAGKIIFSKTPGGAPESKFNGSDFIYATVYFKKPYKGEGFSSHLMVDGDYKLNRDTFYLEKSMHGASSSPLEVAPDPKTAKQSGGKLYTKALSELAEGMTYKVSIKYVDGSSTIEGEFELDLSAGTTFAARDKQFAEGKIANTVMKKPGHSNPALEKDIMATFKKEAAGKGETPLRVVLVEKDWRITRHPLTGVIQFRTIWADIAVQKSDGKYYVYELTYEQQHNGKSYGKTQYNSIGGTYEIPKDNIFK